MGGHARMYNPKTAEGWKAQIGLAAQPHVPGVPIAGPVSLRLHFWFPRPKAHFKKNGSLREGVPLHHSSKPDTDNAAKAVMDALSIIKVWRDDCQVVELIATKSYAAGEPGCTIIITQLCASPAGAP